MFSNSYEDFTSELLEHIELVFSSLLHEQCQ